MRLLPLVLLIGLAGCDLLAGPEKSDYLGTYVLENLNGLPVPQEIAPEDSIYSGVLTLAPERWQMSFQYDRRHFAIAYLAGTYVVRDGAGGSLAIRLDHMIAGEPFQATLAGGVLEVARPSHSSVWRAGEPTVPDQYEP